MSAPAISVILPVWNAGAYLRDAIDSILAQTFTDFELLVVDDGSTDETREAVRSYDDTRIRRIEHDHNLGLTPSLNHALALARGDVIARQDADDVSEPNRLQEQIAFLARHPDVALTGSWCTVIDDRGAARGQMALPTEDLELRWAMWFSCPFVHGAVMWRRVPVRDQVGGYDERFRYSQDYELWTRIAACFAVANVPAYLVRYREHDRSMTATCGAHTGEGRRLRIARAAEALGWAGSDDRLERCFNALSGLVRSSQAIDLTVEEARRAACELLLLHDITCRSAKCDAARADRHLRRVRAAISAALVGLSGRAAERRDLADSARLLSMACVIHRRALAQRRTARAAAHLVRSAITLPGR